MSLLRLYNPHVALDRPNVIECMVGYGDSIAIGRGTDEFMQALVKDIGVQARIVNWTLEACRCKYYCEYAGGDDWQDQWPLVWRVRVELAERPSPLPTRDLPYSGTDAFDSTWHSAPHPTPDSTVICLVLSDFDTQSQLKEAQRAIKEAVSESPLRPLREKYAAGLPVFNQAEVLGGYRQLQADLGKFPGSFFAEGGDYAEGIIALCKMLGGTVNFMDRRPKNR